MGGFKYSINNDLCPQSCDTCDAVMAGSTRVGGGGCQDRNIKISGKTCRQAAMQGYCSYSTNMGSIGTDLCPASCGNCPARPASAAEASKFRDPTPEREHGNKGPVNSDEPVLPADDPETQVDIEEEIEREEEKATEDSEESNEEAEDPHCTDDPVWTDNDGDGCHVYADFIAKGTLSLSDACNYNQGAAKAHCRKTCNTCEIHSSTCKDKECVAKWYQESGKCYACTEWAAFCADEFFAKDCPQTCGTCKASQNIDSAASAMVVVTPPATTTTTTVHISTTLPTAPPVCEDAECVESWMTEFGNCYSCKEFAEEFCGRDEAFMKSCPKSCNMCEKGAEPVCQDDFMPHVCKRYAEWGWCPLEHVSSHCKATCGICKQIKDLEYKLAHAEPGKSAASRLAGQGIALAAIVLLALSQLL